MVKTAWQSLKEADIVVHIIDACVKSAVEDNKLITERLPPERPCVLVLNKTDKADRAVLMGLAQELNKNGAYAATFMISALKEDGINDLMKFLVDHVAEGPFMFPPDQASDMPQRFLAAEVTREKIFDRLHQELPYSIMVATEHWEEFDNGSVKIDQVVFVQRDNQKGIVLGKGGERLKEIGMQSRLELEQLFGRRVHLKLHVKVEENWADRPEFYSMAGMDWPD
jgi:GTP-binding protein Era